MDGFVFIAALFATFLIVAVIGIGKRLDSREIETGVEHPLMFPLIILCGFIMLGGLYYAEVHPIIAHMVAVITGFAAGCGFLLVASWTVRFLKGVPPPQRYRPPED